MSLMTSDKLRFARYGNCTNPRTKVYFRTFFRTDMLQLFLT